MMVRRRSPPFRPAWMPSCLRNWRAPADPSPISCPTDSASSTSNRTWHSSHQTFRFSRCPGGIVCRTTAFRREPTFPHAGWKRCLALPPCRTIRMARSFWSPSTQHSSASRRAMQFARWVFLLARAASSRWKIWPDASSAWVSIAWRPSAKSVNMPCAVAFSMPSCPAPTNRSGSISSATRSKPSAISMRSHSARPAR